MSGEKIIDLELSACFKVTHLTKQRGSLSKIISVTASLIVCMSVNLYIQPPIISASQFVKLCFV